MKIIILFLAAIMISLSTPASQVLNSSFNKQTETSVSVKKPKPGYNKKKRVKQVKKMRVKAAKSYKRSGGDLTKFSCRR